MHTSISRVPTSAFLAVVLAACTDGGAVKEEDLEYCEPATTSSTCSEDPGVVCIMITATEDAVTEIEDGSWDSFNDMALNLTFEIEHTLWNSGLDCSVDAQYDVVIVDPSEIRKDGEPVTDDLLATDADPNPYDVAFANIENLTEVPTVQRDLNADVVVMMVGSAIAEATEETDGSYQSGKANGVQMGDTSDDAFSKWAVYYWNAGRTGPHELGHLLGAQHEYSADTSCGSINFEYNCGFADDDEDAGSIMAYYSSCDDDCLIELMFSNPNREHPDHPGLTFGDTLQYNACTVYQMWEYTSLTSDVYNGDMTQADAAVDPAVYDVDSCPVL